MIDLLNDMPDDISEYLENMPVNSESFDSVEKAKEAQPTHFIAEKEFCSVCQHQEEM
jgi:hypothetical protein